MYPKTADKINQFFANFWKFDAGEHVKEKLQTNSSEKCGATGEKIRARFLSDIFAITRWNITLFTYWKIKKNKPSFSCFSITFFRVN